MTNKAQLCEMLNIDFPVIMAPMFLVSNEEMIIEAINNGITGAIPALNYRTVDELRDAIRKIKKGQCVPKVRLFGYTPELSRPSRAI